MKTQTGPQRIFLTRRDLKAIGVGVSNSTLLRWEELGRFPRRVRFSNIMVAWPREPVMEWCEARISEREKEPSSSWHVRLGDVHNAPSNSEEATMRAFHDGIKTIDERASERMNFRTKPHIKKAIQQAAALSGVDDSVFTMNAAYSSALETIAAHERTMLAPADHAAFFSALDNPPAPTAKLRDAFARHRSRVASK